MLKFLNKYFQNILKIKKQSNKLRIKVTKQVSFYFQFLKFFHSILFLIKVAKYIFKIVK